MIDMEKSAVLLFFVDGLGLRAPAEAATNPLAAFENLAPPTNFRNEPHVWGRMKREISARIKTLADITPAVLHLLS